MNAKRKTMIKSAISIAIFGALSTVNSVAMAQLNNSGGSVNTQGIATSIVIPEYSAGQLQAAGCDANIWNKMVTDYTSAALARNAIANKMQVLNQIQGAPSPYASCFDQAASVINSATSAYNTIKSILTGGGMDSANLYNYAKNLAVGAACSQANQYLAQSSLGTSLTSGVNMVNGGINGTLGTGVNVGGVNVNAGQVLNGGGFQQNNSGNIPVVSGNTIGNAVTGAVNNGGGSFFDSVNPFK